MLRIFFNTVLLKITHFPPDKEKSLFEMNFSLLWVVFCLFYSPTHQKMYLGSPKEGCSFQMTFLLLWEEIGQFRLSLMWMLWVVRVTGFSGLHWHPALTSSAFALGRDSSWNKCSVKLQPVAGEWTVTSMSHISGTPPIPGCVPFQSRMRGVPTMRGVTDSTIRR